MISYLPKRAIILSNSDLSDSEAMLVHSCEDCACAVSDDQRVRSAPVPLERIMADSADGSGGEWISERDTFEVILYSGYWLLFNPFSHGGAVVVNDFAYGIYRSFSRPASVSEVLAEWPSEDGEASRAVARLADLELIRPAGGSPVPRFSEGRVLTAWLHVTNACDLRCPYCYLSKSNERMDEATGRAAVEAVVRSASEHGFRAVKLKYAGGEASLNHRLISSLHALARKLTARHGLDLRASLLTNGVSLPGSLVDLVKSEGIGVMVSLDGIGDEHDAQRPFVSGKPSFRFVERTIGELIAAGVAPHLSITITGRNAAGLANAVRFALDRDLTFSLNFFRDNECAASAPDLRYEEQAMISALHDAFGVIAKYLPRWSVLGSVLDRGQLLVPRQRSCGVGQDYVVIDQRGQVAKCHMEIERTLGDVFSHDPLRLVRDDRRTVLNLAVDEKAGCRDCTWRYWCSSGCAAATYRATGRYDIKSPNCEIYKAIYPAALRLEGLRLLKYAQLPGGQRAFPAGA